MIMAILEIGSNYNHTGAALNYMQEKKQNS